MQREPQEGVTISERTVRVLIADDQAVIRDGLAMLLNLMPNIDVVGTALDGDDAVRQVERLDPDIVLMDLDMPRCSGIQAIERLAATGARSRVIVLTTYSDDTSVFAALRAGARGYLTKDADTDSIRGAIDAVNDGQAQLDPSVQRRLLDALSDGNNTLGEEVPEGAVALPDGLTPREGEVLVHIADGLSNREIAEAMFLSEATVKTHINHLLAKTATRTRAELVGYAYRNKLVRP